MEVELLLGHASAPVAASLLMAFEVLSICGFGEAKSDFTAVDLGRGGVQPIAFKGISFKDCSRS